MIQIRTGVFETNSSSSHSIIMKKFGRVHSPEENAERVWLHDDSTLRFWDHDLEFGRSPFSVLGAWREKAAYAIASYYNDENVYDEIVAACKKHVKGFQDFELPNTPWREDEDVPYHGDIDHQSMGLLQEFLFRHNISVEEFIFNDKYVVIIDGDEYYELQNLVDAGLIDLGMIEEISNACGHNFLEGNDEE